METVFMDAKFITSELFFEKFGIEMRSKKINSVNFDEENSK